MTEIIRNDNTIRIGKAFKATDGYAKRLAWHAPADENTSFVHAAINTAVVTTSGITQPDFARIVSITGGGADHDATGNVIITGTDIKKNVITDTLALNSNTTVNSLKAFATITSIDSTGVTGLDAGANFTVGITDALGLSQMLSEDSLILGTVAGVYEATRPTVVFNATDVSKNTATFNTDLDGASDFVAWFLTPDIS